MWWYMCVLCGGTCVYYVVVHVCIMLALSTIYYVLLLWKKFSKFKMSRHLSFITLRCCEMTPVVSLVGSRPG